ncbi:hypothetical protein EV384_1410 [Micromonospora kangleipakensis]|uniref:Uncharacterized protein n=1 Tax=Micromonospora kangleipakensis TaxID=1077942 RepID=A0A4Q8B6M5_9ACTN|nr:hypothetical protein EV384_1410 [Micromonospora kangleipakensis]
MPGDFRHAGRFLTDLRQRDEQAEPVTVALSGGPGTALGSSHGTYPSEITGPAPTPTSYRPGFPYFRKAWCHMADRPPTLAGVPDGTGWVGASAGSRGTAAPEQAP